ncbi:ATP-binding protein [Saccharomonospora piscinae]|uniref:TraG/VirB4 family ATPase n=1 Tax=Saccharomonospora piscinae TaxID=687388 RepID=UPI00046687E0
MNSPNARGLLRRAARRALGRVSSSGAAGTSAGAVAGPDAVEVGPRWLRVGDGYTATLAITGYPAVGDPVGADLAARLAPYVSGSFSGLFDGPTTRAPDGHLVAISLRDLPDELKSVGTLIALDAVWRRVLDPHHRRRRLVVVDEAWLLMHQPEAARFLYRLAKSARKYWAGLAFVSQDAGDVLATDLGKAIVSNASTQVLLRQSTQAIDTIAEAFHLSDGERAYLLAAGPGEALLVSGTNRVAFHALGSDAEDDLITTDPEFLQRIEGSDANSGWVTLE